MKVLFLIGSYRKNGNTTRVVRRFEEHLNQIAQAQSVPLETETLFLAHMDIGFCRGCRACFDRGEETCPVKDDVPAIKAKIQAADGVVIASPVYVDDVSGITKTFIDRLAHVCHRPEFAGKAASLLVTTGSSPTSHALGTLRMAFNTWGFFIAGKSGFATGALTPADEIRQKYDKKIQQAAQRLFTVLQHREFARPTFLSLMTFKIQQHFWRKNVSDSIDYAYWQSKGWLEPGCEYYIPHQAGRIKTILARGLGSLIAPFVS
jgi:multimeric flavodoxin WrbA